MKKEIVEMYKSLLMLPVIHQNFLEKIYEKPLVKLTKDLLDLLDEEVGLADYGFEDDESITNLIGTQCFAKMYGTYLDEQDLRKTLAKETQYEIDHYFNLTFFDGYVAKRIADILCEPFDCDEYRRDTFYDVADNMRIYEVNGGDLDTLMKDVTKEFKKDKRRSRR